MTSSTRKLFAFVLMPFDKRFDDLYRLGIKDVAGTLNVRAERVDEQKFTEPMLDRIYQQIDAADIVIAEMTGQNPNVFYEVGYAHAKEKLCILSTTDAGDIPFDLKHRRHIVHSGSILKLKQAITEELTWAREEIEKRKRCPIRATFKADADMNRESSWDEVELKLKIDLHSDSNNTALDIDALYLFSSEAWSFKQDGQDCPATDCPERGPHVRRHFLKSPVRRITKDIWGQLRVVGTRIFYHPPRVKPPDSYPIQGKIPISIVTSAGTFEEVFTLDVVAIDIPF
jgi:hypothetical protein